MSTFNAHRRCTLRNLDCLLHSSFSTPLGARASTSRRRRPRGRPSECSARGDEIYRYRFSRTCNLTRNNRRRHAHAPQEYRPRDAAPTRVHARALDKSRIEVTFYRYEHTHSRTSQDYEYKINSTISIIRTQQPTRSVPLPIATAHRDRASGPCLDDF